VNKGKRKGRQRHRNLGLPELGRRGKSIRKLKKGRKREGTLRRIVVISTRRKKKTNTAEEGKRGVRDGDSQKGERRRFLSLMIREKKRGGAPPWSRRGNASLCRNKGRKKTPACSLISKRGGCPYDDGSKEERGG